VRALVVLSFEIPDDRAAFLAGILAGILAKIDPPALPFFAGSARITVDPVATAVERWLDEE
jgi:hypothetical protein